MAVLFVVENKLVTPNTETLMVSPFKEIWERDNSDNKNLATKELTFVEFMSSKKKTNPYAGYDDISKTPFMYQGEKDDRLIPMEKVITISMAGSDKACASIPRNSGPSMPWAARYSTMA